MANTEYCVDIGTVFQGKNNNNNNYNENSNVEATVCERHRKQAIHSSIVLVLLSTEDDVLYRTDRMDRYTAPIA